MARTPAAPFPGAGAAASGEDGHEGAGRRHAHRLLVVVASAVVGIALAVPAGAAVGTPTQWVAKTYTEAAGRAPSPQEWLAAADQWSGRACTAASLGAEGRATYTSPAFLDLGYDEAARLVALYRGALNRDPLEPELALQVPALRSGALAWSAVVDAVFSSQEFSALAGPICDPASPGYSFKASPPGDLRLFALGIPSRSQRELQTDLNGARAACGVVELRPLEVIPIGGDQPGADPDESALRIPPCVTLTTAGRPGPRHYAAMGRLVAGGLVCTVSPCEHRELVEVENGAALKNVWVDGRGAHPRNRGLALVAARSGQAPTEVSQNRLSDPPGGGVALRAEGYDTAALSCAARTVRGNLVTAYASRHAQTRLGRSLFASGIDVFCEQATVEDNELVDVSDAAITVHGSWSSATRERRTQRSTVTGNRIVSAGLSAHVALGADAVGECPAEGSGPPVPCIEFSHDFAGEVAERSFAGTTISANTFYTGSRTHFDVALMVGSKLAWGDNGPLARGVSVTDNTTGGVATRVNTGIAVSGMFDAELRGNTASYDVMDTNPAVSEAKCPRGNVAYGAQLASLTPDSQPATAVAGLRACLAEHPPPGGMEAIKLGPGGTFVGADSGERFNPWGHNLGLGHSVDVLDLRELKQMGTNTVRLHLHFKDIMADCRSAKPAALQELGDTLRRAEENGIYLDLTGLASYAGDDKDPDCYRNATQEGRWSAQEAFWEAVAQKVAPSPAVLAFDIVNEPAIPRGETPCWAGPPPPQQPDAPYCLEPFAGFYFAQNITRTPTGSPADIGRAWLTRMKQAIRAHDPNHLVTLGCLPFTSCAGLDPTEMASVLDYLSVHLYPQDCTGPPPPGSEPDPCRWERGEEGDSGDPLAHERALLDAYASAGDPVVIEETFPLTGTPDLVRRFILDSRTDATGWLGQWTGLTISQNRRIPLYHPFYEWGRVFQRLTGAVTPCSPCQPPRPGSDTPVLASILRTTESAAAAQKSGDLGSVPGGTSKTAGTTTEGEVGLAPVELRSLAVSPRKFVVGSTSSRGRRRGGAVFRYRLSSRAVVEFVIQRRTLGRRVGQRCRRASRRNRRARRCFLYRNVARFTAQGRMGQNRTRFSGRLRRRKMLRPGAYRLLARVLVAPPGHSTAARAHFRVVLRR